MSIQNTPTNTDTEPACPDSTDNRPLHLPDGIARRLVQILTRKKIPFNPDWITTLQNCMKP